MHIIILVLGYKKRYLLRLIQDDKGFGNEDFAG